MKINNVLRLAGCLSLVAASSAFGAATDFSDAGTGTVGTPSVNLRPSKSVVVRYLPSATTVPSGTGVISYSISAFHGSGTKLYASSSGDTKMFMKDATAIADPPAAPAAGASMDATGYTAM